MRAGCVDCVLKHLAQAHILLQESRLGYPDHLYLVIGHLAEAEDEVAELSLQTAREIREMRKRIEEEEDGDFKIMEWVDRILKLEELPGEKTVEEESQHPASLQQQITVT